MRSRAQLAAENLFLRKHSVSALTAACRDGTPDAMLWAAALDPVLDQGLRASTGSPAHFSLFGEVAPILCARGEIDAISRLERIADDYAGSRPLSILCAYSSQGFDSKRRALIATICKEHKAVLSNRRM
jgi:hypothetical protein